MKALVYTGAEQTELRDVPEAIPEEDQCLVDITHCGICGSDMHAWHGHDPRRVPPLILGHEAVGIVRTGSLAGKRVAINPLMTCCNCDTCKSGREHLCAERELIGMRVPGAFAQSVAINERNLSVLPDDLAFAQASLAEPLACAVHSVGFGIAGLTRPAGDAKVVVLGGGAIGLLSALAFRLQGVNDLWVAETNPLRRDMLKQVTDLQSWDPRTENPDANNADIVLDAVGSGITRAAASNMVMPGGTIVHIGLQDNEPGLDTRRLTLQEVRFIGTYCYTQADFVEALSILHSGKINYQGWSDLRPLEAGTAAFQDIHLGAAPPKIILEMPH